jgi:hypothetical protein
MNTEVDKLFELLAAMNVYTAIREVSELEAIKEWAIDSLGLDYSAGDRVRICSDRPWEIANDSNYNGWHFYRNSLTRGQEGIAGEITYNSYKRSWYTLVSFDRARSDSADGKMKFWYGPEDLTPEGYEFAGENSQQFYMQVNWLQKAR